ncbi:adenylate/guanylate cyclase domain-containing protein [Terrarubrum flagellatum]|uniref:adenylate/guanylate cyclase domain-containing protein n=1 Tax=Terrirubrum flagellatum TaxID=2895980 RepID=UPI0031455581
MTATDSARGDQAAVTEGGLLPGAGIPWEKTFRLWSGVVLFVFVGTHLINHAVGVFGVEAMEAAQEWRWLLWKSPAGGSLLYGAVFIHIALTLKRIVTRQTWRMPIDEFFQILLGLLIPVFAISHIVSTRIAYNLIGADESYHAMLYQLWPAQAIWQSGLVIVAWGHGVIGIHHAFRHRRWYTQWRLPALVFAVLLPVLALAGFVASGRENSLRPAPSLRTAEQRAKLERASMLLNGAMSGVALLAIGVIAFGAARRRAARQIVVNYRGRGPVRVPRGTSILEASRINGIPHPSVCGGRGRCSTCRVHVLSALSKLPEPNTTERAMLTRIGAQPGVRLACQLRPVDNISVRILLPVLGGKRAALADVSGEEWGVQRDATILFFDLRAFNALTRSQLPYEVAVLVNRLFSEMKQAVEHYGGRIDMFLGDGFIAVFDREGDSTFGARSALLAAGDISRVLETLNVEMGSGLPIPIRAGVGIHTGPTIIARIGEDPQHADMMALGPTVTIAESMQNATKEALVDFMVSEAAALASGFNFAPVATREVAVERLNAVMMAYALIDSHALLNVIGRASADGKLADASA